MSDVMLRGTELLQWTEETAERWFVLMEEHPDILAMPCDIMNVKTVAELMQHITAVELRYAQRLMDEELISYDQVPYGSVAELRATHARAHAMYADMLKRDDLAWGGETDDDEIDIVTRSAGTIRATRRKIFFHAQMHSIRHYAQLATLVRQNGYKPGWMMDLMGSQAMR